MKGGARMSSRIALAGFLGVLAAAWVAVAMSGATTTPAPPKPVAGCLNQALTDGFWNLKVTAVTLGTEPEATTPAWGATFEFGNAQTKAAIPNSVGVDYPKLVLSDGTTLDMTTTSELKFQRAIQMATLQPGAQKSGTYWYRPDDPATKASTFLFPVSASNSVYNTSFGYPVKNPAFSVDLTCNKG